MLRLISNHQYSVVTKGRHSSLLSSLLSSLHNKAISNLANSSPHNKAISNLATSSPHSKAINSLATSNPILQPTTISLPTAPREKVVE